MRPFSTISWRLAALFALLSTVMLAAPGCGDDEEAENCSGRTLVPHLSPISFNELWPPSPDEPDELGSSVRTPYEWVLRLQAKGIDDTPSCESVAISEICMVGSAEALAQFITYPDAPLTADPGDSNDATIQVTYQRETPSTTIDAVAMVVQSNATNFPTLVVPFCARVVPDGEPKNMLFFPGEEHPDGECTSPVQAPPAGERDDTLCP
jgi:hypothetical protein